MAVWMAERMVAMRVVKMVVHLAVPSVAVMAALRVSKMADRSVWLPVVSLVDMTAAGMEGKMVAERVVKMVIFQGLQSVELKDSSKVEKSVAKTVAHLADGMAVSKVVYKVGVMAAPWVSAMVAS